MMTRLTKKNMVDALMAAGVEVQKSYTMDQLLLLYDGLGAAATTGNDAPESSKPSETPANDVIISETSANFEKPSEMAGDASENNVRTKETSETKLNDEKNKETSAAKKNKDNAMNQAYKWPNVDDFQDILRHY